MQVVVETLEQTIAQVHVSNRINSLRELHTSRHLTVSVSPLMLNTLHMPLVYNDDNLLLRAFVNGLEKILITLIHENLLESWEEDVQVLNVPVHKVCVGTFF